MPSPNIVNTSANKMSASSSTSSSAKGGHFEVGIEVDGATGWAKSDIWWRAPDINPTVKWAFQNKGPIMELNSSMELTEVFNM